MDAGASVLAYFAIAQLIKAIVTYGRDMLEYSKERELFLGELEALAEILSRLKLLVESKSHSSPLDPWIEALQKLDLFQDNAVLGQTLQDIALKLGVPDSDIYTLMVTRSTPSATPSDRSLRRKVFSGARKIKAMSIWALIGKSDMVDLLARVQRMCQMAQIALSAYSAEQLAKMSETVHQHLDLYQQRISAKLDEGLEQIRDQVASLQQESKIEKDDVRVRKFITELHPVDSETKHWSILEQKQNGTCTWLLNHPCYTSWLFSKESVLCLLGQPGSGKSVLCSSVIEALRSTNIIYHYCDFRDQNSTNVKTIFHSLLAQLAKQNSEQWNEKLRQITDSKLNVSQLRLMLDNVVDMIIDDISSRHKQQYVVIDALDECEDFDLLIPCLLRLVSIPQVSLLLSSRQERDIYDLLSDHSIISLMDEGESVLADITTHIARELKDRQKLSRLPSPLKADITTTLTRKADGMFRWVQCQLDSLIYCRTAGAVKDALLNLPKTLYETYERILSSIDAKGPTETHAARRILQWIVGSSTPITLTEISSALQIEVGQPKLNEDLRLFDEEEILSICKSLVICRSGVVSLSHFTVKEFLVQETLAGLNIGHYTMLNSTLHYELSLHCLTYLLLDVFKMGPAPSKELYAERLKEYPFLPCAVIQLPDHLSSAPQNNEEIYSLISRLLLDPTLRHYDSFTQTEQFMSFIGFTSKNYDVLNRDHSYVDIGLSPPWFVAWCRTGWIAQRLLRERPEWLNAEAFSPNWIYGTPLCWAIHMGSWDIVQVILDSGADIDKKSVVCETRFRHSRPSSPLEHAFACRSSGEGVKLLLDRGAKVSFEELSSVVYHAREEFIPLVLERCPLSQLQPHERSEIIVTAVRTGHIGMVQALLDAGCDPNAVDPGSGKGTLQAAIELGTTGVVDVLIRGGASPEALYQFISPDQLDWASSYEWYSQCLSMGPSSSKKLYSAEELQNIHALLVIKLGLPVNVAIVVMDLAEHWANKSVSRNEEISFTQNSEEIPYLRVVAPNGNLRSIVFITSSHDQGYSGEPEVSKGTYQNSHTWFEAAIMRHGEQVGGRRFIQANVHASWQSRTHRNIWNMTRADRDSDMYHWMMSISAGDEIWMLPRAQYPGWVNYVQAAEITICYTEDVVIL
ncbi:hypothetical protein BT96DRAFT_1015751 [Gymnopus androsaceus JB14]|uniref:Uncharacterized protein n=1 Tax=Gymnopus androsaceus JB14 TaxID=1447944 RepID=A0A6A4I615_9AGAR|nr:hypothetical protein BT96DRAFT_1015751 [Gymnopus androsaceus JB14]